MTNSANPLTSHRDELKAALKASADGVGYTYVAPIREQISALEDDGAILLPGELCLAVAEAYGANAASAMPAAIALSLLGAMGRIYDDIAAEGAGPLERVWGLPRTLNTLDAFFALAQSRFLDAVTALPERFRREAVKLLDEACHHLSIDLHEGAGRKETLLSAAATLGGMFADADPQQVVALTVFGMVPSAETLAGLSEPAQSSLRATLPYITTR
jgi:hypothetical protein